MNKYERVAELLAASHPDMVEFAAVAGGMEFVEEFSLSLVECAVGILTKSLTMKDVKSHSGAALRLNCFITALRSVGEFAGCKEIRQDLDYLSALLNSNSCPLQDLNKAVDAMLAYQEKLETCQDMSEIPAVLFHIVDPTSTAVSVLEVAQACLVSRSSEGKAANALADLGNAIDVLKRLTMTDWSDTALKAWREHADVVIEAIAKAETMKVKNPTQATQVDLRRDLLADIDLHVGKLCRQRQAFVLDEIFRSFDRNDQSAGPAWICRIEHAVNEFKWAERLGLGRGPIPVCGPQFRAVVSCMVRGLCKLN